ncbi:STOREKEEPER protein [Sesamum alatum]|uniref:STOREKEEPER protein n=1 Tax=Sesamum alatum TaxID=300844 RepID=A0AAE2C9F0_9LAMI|nr:STOREKEEPER protein [Sesamum alatum]
MRPEKLSFIADGEEEEDKQQALNEADEETDSDSESESEEEEGKAAVPPKKPKLNPPREEEGPVPGEQESECSSPSASDFIIMPAAKPGEKSTPFVKKFSEEDEIALLEGLAIFWADGRNNRWAEFYNFIKDSLPHQFTRTQVSEKIRRLKTKFENNYKRARATGGRLDLSDAHESTVFEVSKTLWGEDQSEAGDKHGGKEKETPHWGDKSRAQKKRIRTGKEHDAEKEIVKNQKQVGEIGKEEFASAYPLLSSSLDKFGYPNIIKENIVLIGKEKAQELEEKWRDVKAAELNLDLKRIDLIRRDLHNQLSSK